MLDKNFSVSAVCFCIVETETRGTYLFLDSLPPATLPSHYRLKKILSFPEDVQVGFSCVHLSQSYVFSSIPAMSWMQPYFF